MINVVTHVKKPMTNVLQHVLGHNVVLSKLNTRIQQVRNHRLFICLLNSRKYLVTERQCTTEQWTSELLTDGCISYMKTYWCMCSSDMCNGGDLESIRG